MSQISPLASKYMVNLANTKISSSVTSSFRAVLSQRITLQLFFIVLTSSILPSMLVQTDLPERNIPLFYKEDTPYPLDLLFPFLYILIALLIFHHLGYCVASYTIILAHLAIAMVYKKSVETQISKMFVTNFIKGTEIILLIIYPIICDFLYLNHGAAGYIIVSFGVLVARVFSLLAGQFIIRQFQVDNWICFCGAIGCLALWNIRSVGEYIKNEGKRRSKENLRMTLDLTTV